MKRISSSWWAPGLFAACGRLTCPAWCCDPRLPAPASRGLHRIQSSRPAAETPAPGKGGLPGGLCGNALPRLRPAVGTGQGGAVVGGWQGQSTVPGSTWLRTPLDPPGCLVQRLASWALAVWEMSSAPALPPLWGGTQKAQGHENAGPEPTGAGCKRRLQPFPAAKPG